ncbi:MAG: hypothetical protein JWM55_293 [Acidimicrobiaceae bacterium]|nr:hypothetical protein [Acidimicrobiaceae bacterium]
MPRIVGPGSSKALAVVVVLALVFGFTPISRALLRAVDGSFEPSRYSALALRNPSLATQGVLAGESISLLVSNHTGHAETYHWSATQGKALISLGVTTLANGRTTTVSVPSRGAVSGTMKIALSGDNVFVTVPVVGS